MPGKAPHELFDLALTTLDDLPKGEFEEMWTHNDYEFARIYEQSRRQIDSGKAITRNVRLDPGGNARYRKLYDIDQPAVTDVQHQITVPWCQIGTNWSYDVFELKMNTGAAGFIELIKSRRNSELEAYANLFEERGWKTPISATDTTHPFGVPYYLPMLDAGSTDGGFNAQTIRFQDGSTSSICAGIDASAEPRWRAYADTYDMVDGTLLKKIRRAIRLTKFKPPKLLSPAGDNEVGKHKSFYGNIDIVTELEELADARDDNNAPDDLMGKVKISTVRTTEAGTFINRMPVVYIDLLDGVDHDPLYCIDWSKLQPIVFEGHWMEQSDSMSDRSQHTTLTVFLDSAHQNLCINRRTAGFTMHKPIPE